MGALAKKMQLQAGHRVAVINPPLGYIDRLLQPVQSGAELVEPTEGADLDFVQLFVHDRAELDQHAPTALGAVKDDGLLWICYPKGGSKAGTDLNRDILWQRMQQDGVEGVSLIAIDEVWSAMRFRPADKVGT